MLNTGKSKSNWKNMLMPPSSCLLNIQDRLYHFMEEGMQEVSGIEALGYYLYYFTDFSDFFDMGTLDVQGDYKYAQLLARRRLEDEGKLEDEDRLLIYAKQRLEKGSTRICYGIVPAERYNFLHKFYEHYPYGLIYFDPGTVLFGLLSKLEKSSDHAIALCSNRAIIAVYGRHNQVVQFKSYHLRDNTLDSLQEGISFVQDDIQILNWQGCSIYKLVLLESLSEQSLNTEGIDTETEQPFKRTYTNKGQRINSSLPELLPILPVNSALAPKEEKVYRYLDKGRKWLLCLLLFFILCASILIGKFTVDYLQLEKQVSSSQSEITALQDQITREMKQTKFEHANEIKKMQNIAENVLKIWLHMRLKFFKIRHLKKYNF